MGLLTPGYWPSTYWPANYWIDRYWPNFGFIAPSALRKVEIKAESRTVFILPDIEKEVIFEALYPSKTLYPSKKLYPSSGWTPDRRVIIQQEERTVSI